MHTRRRKNECHRLQLTRSIVFFWIRFLCLMNVQLHWGGSQQIYCPWWYDSPTKPGAKAQTLYGLNSSFDHTGWKTVTLEFLGIIICSMMGFLFDCTVYGNCFEFYHNCHMRFLQSHRWFNIFWSWFLYTGSLWLHHWKLFRIWSWYYGFFFITHMEVV
jgi:hypothetical protein